MHDVQGNPIEDWGTTDVALQLNSEKEHHARVDFRISAVNDHVMSAGKVINRKTFRATLDSDGSYLQQKNDERVCIPL